jgi:hypothetical protein
LAASETITRALPTKLKQDQNLRLIMMDIALPCDKKEMKLVGGFVGFCARNFRVFQSVPIFAWKRKAPMNIALKSMF